MGEPPAVRRRVLVHGAVQGVFFRDSTRTLAQATGVSGWVRNRPDGTVEAVFEGEPTAVQQMLEFSRSGPAEAEVRRIDVSDEKPEGISGFRVR